MKDLKCFGLYGIMAVAKKATSVSEQIARARWEKIWSLDSDHNLDHLQHRTTWELLTLQHVKARFSDEKARKSTQNEAKSRCFCVWELDAAGSSPVTSTKKAGESLLFLLVEIDR